MNRGDDNVDFGPDLTIEIDNLSQTNSVWHFFGYLLRSGEKIDKTHKYCNECLKLGKIFRYGLRTSNGNHRTHLKTVHKIDLLSAIIDKNQRKVSDMLSNTSSSLPETPTKEKRFLLARQMALWFCRDLESFNAANKDGFTDFSKWAGIIKRDEKLPDRNTISHAALRDIYSVIYKNVSTKLQDSLPNVLPISFDFWTDNAKRMSYLSYWTYWIDSNFVMNKVCLRTFYFPHPHTGEQIAKSFKDLKSEFKFEDKKFFATTDSGKNLIKACNDLDLPREPCVCHNMHLLVATDLLKHKKMKSVRVLIKKMKRIMKSLMYSYEKLKLIHDKEYNKRLYEILLNLEEISEILDVGDVEISDFDIEEDVEMMENFLDSKSRKNNEYKTLKNSNATRWNSVLSMFRSFVKNIDVINRCLEINKTYDDILSDTDLEICKDIIKVLEVFESATDLLQGDYPTLNLTLVTYVEIKKLLQGLRRDKKSSQLTIEAVDILLENFSNRFPISKNMILAAYMDPSFKDLPIIDTYLDSEGITIDALIREKCEEFDISKSPPAVVESKAVSSKQSSGNSVRKMRLELIEKHTNVESSNSFQDCLTTEMNKYYPINEVVEDVLEWWKEHKNEFPILSQLARIVLSLMGSSCVTERHFSKCGVLITKRKSRVDPMHLQEIMFVNENFQFYNN